jgi:hypothetical protein
MILDNYKKQQEKKFNVKIQDQNYKINYEKWYEITFRIKGIKNKEFIIDEVLISEK